jgi:hypothetical protein
MKHRIVARGSKLSVNRGTVFKGSPDIELMPAICRRDKSETCNQDHGQGGGSGPSPGPLAESFQSPDWTSDNWLTSLKAAEVEGQF